MRACRWPLRGSAGLSGAASGAWQRGHLDWPLDSARMPSAHSRWNRRPHPGHCSASGAAGPP
eukprot:819527-Alexandrium_andersonii.AAC.1